MAIGLGALIFVGGWLNLASMATGPVLDALVLAGLLFAGVGWIKRAHGPVRLTAAAGLAAVPLLLAAAFLAVYLTPVPAYNYHDDLERYFAYPVRMLATGTLAANPIGYLGADTLGAGAFLQAFVVAHFPIEYVGSVDLAGGFLLCLALAGFGLPVGRRGVMSIVAQCLVLVVNPQLANISSAYGAAALIMGAVLLAGEPAADERAGARAAVTGLFCAGMIALKTTFIVFVGAHLLVGLVVGFAPWWRRWHSCWVTGAWAVIGLLPWLFLNAPLYWAAWQAEQLPAMTAGLREPLELWSSTPLLYGSTQAHFTALAVLGWMLAAWYGFAAWRSPVLRDSRRAAAIQAGLTGGLMYFALVVGLGSWMYGREAATRYSIPVLIATLPLAVRLGGEGVGGWRWPAVLPAAGGLGAIFLFAPSLHQRVKIMAATHVPWAYFVGYSPGSRDEFLAYNRAVLSGEAVERLARIQSLVPEHERLGVWVMTPFQLDFRRNPIWHADPYGIAMPWAPWPMGVRYFLLEYNGPAVRSGEVYEVMKTAPGASDRMVAFRVEEFMRRLMRAAPPETFIYRDDTYVLIRFPES